MMRDIDRDVISNELLLQKMSRQLKCLKGTELDDAKIRRRRYSFVVNDFTNGHKDASLSARMLELDSEAYRTEVVRRQDFDV